METKKHRIFLDSNVVLSGLVSSQGAPCLILDLLSLDLPPLQGLTGRFNLTEIERDIAKRVPAALTDFDDGLPKLDLDIIPVPFPEELELFRGSFEEKDLPVLASAIMGKADYFVSGDKALLSRIGREGVFPVRSLSPAEFLDTVLPGILAGGRL
jgi:predicted nucleic acid-binding protein